MNNQSLKRSLTATAILASSISTAHGQSLVDQIGEAISGGSVNFNMRFRHESVQQDNALLDADASTVRTRLTLQSAPVSGFSGFFEVDNVSTIGSDHYDSFVMDEYRGNYSIIADPVGTEVNQAYLQYQANDTFRTRLGMQRILHAGQRFVGGVGWRQNEQTFDALTTSYFSEQTTVDYSYVWNVNRIFKASRQSVQLTDLDSDSHFLLASRKTDAGTFSGYIYALDFSQAGALSSLTTGLSYTGGVGPATLSASFAMQSDYGNAPVDYSANYLNLELVVPIAPVTATLGYELLGSDNGVKAFTTPLATLHKWQGWTDLFLGTPANGIEDSYLTLAGNTGKLALSATFHNFSADEGGADYGTEWDLVATFPINDKISTQLKYASYDSDGYAVDTDKLWLMLNVVF